MLYLEIEPEALRFLSLENGVSQQTCYRMQPTLSFDRNLRQAIASMPQSASTLQAVRVIVAQSGTAMPLADFSEEISESVYHHCFAEREDDRVFYDMIPEAGAVWIYGLPKDMCSTLENIFGEVLYASLMAPTARHAFVRAKDKSRLIQASYRESWLDIVALSDNHLLLANSYVVTTPADAAYYILGVFKRLNFNQQEDYCLLTGSNTALPTLTQEIQRFVANTDEQESILPDILKYLH